MCVCVRTHAHVCVQHDNLSVYVVEGAKQISNPRLNPSSCSDYKSAGALRSNQQEQSAASADTLSIRGARHTVTNTHMHIKKYIHPYKQAGNCNSLSLPLSRFLLCSSFFLKKNNFHLFLKTGSQSFIRPSAWRPRTATTGRDASLLITV